MNFKKSNSFVLPIVVTIVFFSCGNNAHENGSHTYGQSHATDTAYKKEEKIDFLKEKGIGPVKSLTLDAVNLSLAEHGKMIYDMKCAACHKMGERYVGPALRGVTKRRTPEWIMNMILNPVEMTKEDPIAKKLLEDYLSQMSYQDVKEDEARALLEYFRMEDGAK